MLGLAWLIVLPVVMASLYTLVFWGVFQARWPAAAGVAVATQGHTQEALAFGLRLFAGLAVFQFFADVMVRSTRAITDNAPLVKRLRFPVMALVLGQVISGFVSLVVALAICLGFAVFGFGAKPDLFALSGVLCLVLLIAFGLGLGLAAVSTYLRDLQQVVPALVTGLLFASPVFYPASQAKGLLAQLLVLNPLAMPIELARGSVFGDLAWGAGTADQWLTPMAWSLGLMVLGGWVFLRLQKGFADLI